MYVAYIISALEAIPIYLSFDIANSGESSQQSEGLHKLLEAKLFFLKRNSTWNFNQHNQKQFFIDTCSCYILIMKSLYLRLSAGNILLASTSFWMCVFSKLAASAIAGVFWSFQGSCTQMKLCNCSGFGWHLVVCSFTTSGGSHTLSINYD